MASLHFTRPPQIQRTTNAPQHPMSIKSGKNLIIPFHLTYTYNSTRGHLGRLSHNNPRLPNPIILRFKRRTHSLRQQQINLRQLNRRPRRVQAVYTTHRPNNRRPLLALGILHSLRGCLRRSPRMGSPIRRNYKRRIRDHRREDKRYCVGWG